MSTWSPPSTTKDLDGSNDARAPLLESTVYTQVIPVFVISLVSFYILVCIAKYLYWQYRRRRKRQLQLEVGRLRSFWLRAMADIQEQQRREQERRILEKQQEIKHLAPVIPRPATYPNFIYTSICTSDITLITSTTTNSTARSSPSSSPNTRLSSSSSSWNNIHPGGARPHSVIGTPLFHPPTSCSYESDTTLRPCSPTTLTLHPDQSAGGGGGGGGGGGEFYHEKHARKIVDNREQLKYWKRNKRKRRHLLWQWSVAMGYCRYSHASKLTELIARLQEDAGGKE